MLRELTLRDNIRSAVKRNVTSLVDLINNIVTHIRANLPEGKELLVIIDDLEKIPDVKKADDLFIQAGSYMTTPKCKIIFTVPIALYYSLKFQQLSDTFGKTYPLPNIKVYAKGNPENIDPSGCMHEFFKKRINERLFEKSAIDTAIFNSGGVAREFVRILKNSCTKALAQSRDTVTKDIVDAVIINLRNEFSRGLEKRHMDVLKAYLNNLDTDDDRTKMELFHAKVLLEYLNGSKWVEINPIVKPLIR